MEVGTCRNTSTPYTGIPQECAVSPPLSKDGDHVDNNNANADDLTYLRHLELEPLDPLTGQPLHPGFTAKGGRTPCTITRRLLRQSGPNQVIVFLLSIHPLEKKKKQTNKQVDKGEIKIENLTLYLHQKFFIEK